MLPNRQGSFHLFRIAGIEVKLHWSWFLVAAFEITSRNDSYTSFVWNALEYLSLFAIVLMHEFGHALACRQVGGTANRIILWPLGGVAYVDPPQRPGAMLWSIAAGPLVNVVLMPVFAILWFASRSLGWPETDPNIHHFLTTLLIINIMLLGFNLLPVYPLDGGQILRSLLWFFLGRARSLMIASVIGLIGVAGLVVIAVWKTWFWGGIIAAFVFMNCWGGLRMARAMAHLDKAPRRKGFACPSCKAAPAEGPFWVCGRCRKPFDTFESQAVCPHCDARFDGAMCLDCGAYHSIEEWRNGATGEY